MIHPYCLQGDNSYGFIVNNYDVDGSILQGQMCPAVPVCAL